MTNPAPDPTPIVSPFRQAPAAPAEDVARTAGRGGAAVAGAKLYFLVIGLLQQTLLPRVLGVSGYGAFSRVLAVVNVANNVVIASGIQGASRFVAQASDDTREAAGRATVRLHALLALPLATAFFFVAPLVAEHTGGAHVAGEMRVVSLVLLAYVIYAPLIGILNGRRRFVAQAALDSSYGTLRTIGLLVGGWALARAGLGPLGATWGFVIAALLIVPAAAVVVGLGRRPAPREGPAAFSSRAYFAFLAPLALGQFFLNLLMQVDITLLGKFASDAATAEGEVGHDKADFVVGLYRNCQVFSFLPYQLLFSITFILFPMLARAAADGDNAAVARYVRTGTRLACVLTGGMVAVSAGLAPQLLRLVFGPIVASAGFNALRLLAVGQGAFALFGIETTILSSLHRERLTMALNAVALAAVIALAYLTLPGPTPSVDGVHASVLVGVAGGSPLAERMAKVTTAAMAFAVIAGGVAVVRTTGTLVRPLAALRAGAAFAIAAFVGSRLPVRGRILTLAEVGVVVVVYASVLLITRELGKDDWAMVMRVVGRGARRAPG